MVASSVITTAPLTTLNPLAFEENGIINPNDLDWDKKIIDTNGTNISDVYFWLTDSGWSNVSDFILYSNLGLGSEQQDKYSNQKIYYNNSQICTSDCWLDTNTYTDVFVPVIDEATGNQLERKLGIRYANDNNSYFAWKLNDAPGYHVERTFFTNPNGEKSIVTYEEALKEYIFDNHNKTAIGWRVPSGDGIYSYYPTITINKKFVSNVGLESIVMQTMSNGNGTYSDLTKNGFGFVASLDNNFNVVTDEYYTGKISGIYRERKWIGVNTDEYKFKNIDNLLVAIEPELNIDFGKADEIFINELNAFATQQILFVPEDASDNWNWLDCSWYDLLCHGKNLGGWALYDAPWVSFIDNINDSLDTFLVNPFLQVISWFDWIPTPILTVTGSYFGLLTARKAWGIINGGGSSD